MILIRVGKNLFRDQREKPLSLTTGLEDIWPSFGMQACGKLMFSAQHDNAQEQRYPWMIRCDNSKLTASDKLKRLINNQLFSSAAPASIVVLGAYIIGADTLLECPYAARHSVQCISTLKSAMWTQQKALLLPFSTELPIPGVTTMSTFLSIDSKLVIQQNMSRSQLLHWLVYMQSD